MVSFEDILLMHKQQQLFGLKEFREEPPLLSYMNVLTNFVDAVGR